MKYISTRSSISIAPHEAIIKGLADDGGLFVPEKIPSLPVQDTISLSYEETAVRILSLLFDDFSKDEIHNCVYSAYEGKFDDERIVPLRPYENGYLMELWHGPTSAFKDIALTLLPHLMTAAYKKDHRHDIISILTATSGDTGKAALNGFADVPHTAITVFYPEIGVSPIQKRQMNTSRGKNVDVIAVKGNFDDCQRMVKQAASDPLVLSSLHNVVISSANSINIGRLVPQIVYYYTSYAQLVHNGSIKCGDQVDFVVPTGNFGDILAGCLAKKMGLPVHKLICASNSNNVLTDFLRTGTYSVKRPFHTTMSPSMDILISSNLERLLYLVSGDSRYVSALMKDLNEKGSYQIASGMLKTIQETFAGYWTSEEECADTIYDMWHNQHILIDPHTAVAVHACSQYQNESGTSCPCIVLSTASPYKFSHDVLRSIHEENPADDFEAMDKLHEISAVQIPEGLAELKNLPVRFNRVIRPEEGMRVIAGRMEEVSHAED